MKVILQLFFFTEYGNIQGWAKKGPIQILYRNSVLRYAIALNFGRNTTIIAINSNWYIEWYWLLIVHIDIPSYVFLKFGMILINQKKVINISVNGSFYAHPCTTKGIYECCVIDGNLFSRPLSYSIALSPCFYKENSYQRKFSYQNSSGSEPRCYLKLLK